MHSFLAFHYHVLALLPDGRVNSQEVHCAKCRDTPGKARTAVIRIKEELADAKGEVIERMREVQARSLSLGSHRRFLSSAVLHALTKDAMVVKIRLSVPSSNVVLLHRWLSRI